MIEHQHQWWNLFSGVPVGFQVLFWVVFVITLSSFISIVALVSAAGRQRRRRKRSQGIPESEFLWVFVVPALNEEVTIADSVARLGAAEATNAVILVVDDGSDDATPSILAALDEPRLRVLRRELPNARKGKAQGLNDAYRYVRERLLAEPAFSPFTSDRVIMVIVDADGRLAPHAPRAVAWHFADPTMGGVQCLVRIYNRQGYLTWAQDVEFGSFGFVYQAGRSAWGTANMGGNAQFNRLSALESIEIDGGPWRERLTEDQDLGVRLLQAGWRGGQENGCQVDQQGLNSLRKLYRQRTRWGQGAWQAVPLVGGVGRMRPGVRARIDAGYYLITPVLQLITGIDFVATIVLTAVWQIPLVPATITVALVFITLGFGPGLLTLLFRGRGFVHVLVSILQVIPYTAYTWLVFPTLARALFRQLSGRTGWAKTAREPLGPSS
ncbi:glycosyltransferase [Planctomonas sp. JC2975]|uniref:glycosyltransferase n=1 Tax=Planctomonas sp. JC2975 TaxID=2729626 RepID=UPI001474B7E6|nr:glycosyltransferase [Planctomonas sp. JC2975]NNC11277.1 glycosyltransferase [Planctomonas sp. JC2975]